jgi:hypothetical protein
MEYDELNREIAAKRILNEFIALQPSFPPTFKRIRKECIMKSSSPKTVGLNWIYSNAEGIKSYYHKKRIPSYTDRILYKSSVTFQNWVSPLFFESCENALSSDHKPVRAGFNLKISKGENDIVVDRQLIGKIKKPAESKNKEPKLLKLQAFDLKGYDLEEMDLQAFGGGSDPYIVITTDPPSLLLHKQRIRCNVPGLKSKVIKHDVNPVWPDPMYLSIGSVDLEGLSKVREAGFLLSFRFCSDFIFFLWLSFLFVPFLPSFHSLLYRMLHLFFKFGMKIYIIQMI